MRLRWCVKEMFPPPSKRALTPEGTCVLIGHDQYGEADRRWIGSLGRFAKLLVLSPFVSQLPGLRGAKDPRDRLVVLKELIEAGKITPVIDRRYPQSEVPRPSVTWKRDTLKESRHHRVRRGPPLRSRDLGT